MPVRVGPDGRAVTVEGTEQLKKIISLGLSDKDSCNPFQDEGIGKRFVFALPDERTVADVSARVRAVFTRLSAQGRARLVAGYPKFEIDHVLQDLVVDIRFIDLEATKEAELAVRFGLGAAGELMRRG